MPPLVKVVTKPGPALRVTSERERESPLGAFILNLSGSRSGRLLGCFARARPRNVRAADICGRDCANPLEGCTASRGDSRGRKLGGPPKEAGKGDGCGDEAGHAWLP